MKQRILLDREYVVVVAVYVCFGGFPPQVELRVDAGVVGEETFAELLVLLSGRGRSKEKRKGRKRSRVGQGVVFSLGPRSD